MRTELFLLVNPRSGTMKIKPALLRIVQLFSEAGYRVTVYPTRSRGDACEVVRTLPPEFETVVCCGGDGTLNEVITGLLRSGVRRRLGYLPAGTLNEWSAGLKISRNLERAAADLLTGREVPLDVGRFCDRYFAYTASFGAFTEASYSAPQDVKNVLGQAAYFFEGIKSLGNIKSHRMRVTFADGGVCEGEFLFGAVSNSLSVGGIVKFKEALVRLNDGRFEVVLIRNPKNVAELQRVVAALLRQSYDDPLIVFSHTSGVTVTGDAIPWTLDGERADGPNPTEIAILPGAVRFLLPQRSGDALLAHSAEPPAAE